MLLYVTVLCDDNAFCSASSRHYGIGQKKAQQNRSDIPPEYDYSNESHAFRVISEQLKQSQEAIN